MTADLDGVSAEWRAALDAIDRRRTSPTLLPLALLAIARLHATSQADQQRTLAFADFESAFKTIAQELGVVTRSGPWMPYLALSGPVGLLTLLDNRNGEPVRLSGASRPKSRAALVRASTRAQVAEPLSPELQDATRREQIEAWARRILETEPTG